MVAVVYAKPHKEYMLQLKFINLKTQKFLKQPKMKMAEGLFSEKISDLLSAVAEFSAIQEKELAAILAKCDQELNLELRQLYSNFWAPLTQGKKDPDTLAAAKRIQELGGMLTGKK